MADSSEETADILCAEIAVIAYDAQADAHDILLVRNDDGLALPGGRKNAHDGGNIKRTAVRRLGETLGIFLSTDARLRVFDVTSEDGQTTIVFILETLPQEAASARAADGVGEMVRARLRNAHPMEMAFGRGETIRRLKKEYN